MKKLLLFLPCMALFISCGGNKKPQADTFDTLVIRTTIDYGKPFQESVREAYESYVEHPGGFITKDEILAAKFMTEEETFIDTIVDRDVVLVKFKNAITTKDAIIEMVLNDLRPGNAGELNSLVMEHDLLEKFHYPDGGVHIVALGSVIDPGMVLTAFTDAGGVLASADLESFSQEWEASSWFIAFHK